MPLAIFLHHQASKFVSSCHAHCWALLWRASSVGCSSSEDDSLDSLEGMFSLRLGWHHFCWVDWIFPPYQTCACQRCGLHQRGYFRLESGPDPSCHRRPPGHHSRPQHHPHKPLHDHLHGGHPPPHGSVHICCWFPSHR